MKQLKNLVAFLFIVFFALSVGGCVLENSEKAGKNEKVELAEEDLPLDVRIDIRLLKLDAMVGSTFWADYLVDFERQEETLKFVEEIESLIPSDSDEYQYAIDICQKYRDEVKECKAYREHVKEKMSEFKMSESMDLSRPIGLTSDELAFILGCANNINEDTIFKNGRYAEAFAYEICKNAEKYSVNEIFAISVMAYETAFFTSDFAEEYNNYCGITENGNPCQYGHPIDGMKEAMKYISENLTGNISNSEQIAYLTEVYKIMQYYIDLI